VIGRRRTRRGGPSRCSAWGTGSAAGSARTTLLLAAIALLAGPGVVPTDAQDWRRRQRPDVPEGLGALDYDGRLTFARVRFQPRTWGGWSDNMPPWGHDYPRAERNFMQIFQEITMARTFTDGSRIVNLDDPDLFNYPIAYLCEPGYWTMTEEEEAALRAYLLKGGFVIFDDFVGPHWDNFALMMDRVLPGVEFFPMDVAHPLFHAFFEVESLDILEPYRGRHAQFYGVYEDNDPDGRLLAIVNYNADIGEYFQYSDTGWMPVDISNEAYKLGINYWMYALTR
jgi:hypothetical protein